MFLLLSLDKNLYQKSLGEFAKAGRFTYKYFFSLSRFGFNHIKITRDIDLFLKCLRAMKSTSKSPTTFLKKQWFGKESRLGQIHFRDHFISQIL